MSTPTITPPHATVPNLPEIPPLQNGDRLTRAEFERRYQAMPELKKAELIEGVVYVPSPVKFRQHGGPHFNLFTLLGQYCPFTPGAVRGGNSTVDVDHMNE